MEFDVYGGEGQLRRGDIRPRRHSEIVLRKTGDHFDVPANRIHRIIDLPEGECRTMVRYGEPMQKVGFFRFEGGTTLHRLHDQADFKPIIVSADTHTAAEDACSKLP